MENYSPLYKSLYTLYLKASEKIIAARNNGILVKIPYERIKVRDLDFDMGHTSFQYDWNDIEYFDYYEWSTNEFTNFMDKELKPLPECDIAVEKICKTFQISDDVKRFIKEIGLFGFLRLLMKQIPNGTINHQNIGDYIKTFISDYEIYKSDNLFIWHIQLWLDYLHFENKALQIGEFAIRKPEKEDLTLVRQKSYYIDDFQKMTGRSLPSTAILEFSMRAKKDGPGIYIDEIKDEIESYLNVFRLFKVGNITVTHQSVTPASISEYGHSESIESPFDKSWKDKVEHKDISKYEYLVKKDEESQLVKFFQKIKPILKNISPKKYLSGNYLDLAVHRYNDSLLRSEVNVYRMVSAITCLEALLSNSPFEVTYKISIHVAGVLRHFGFNTVRVYEKMKTAYDIRSKLLHGSKMDNKMMAFSKNHTHEIVNYARVCLLVSLQLKDKLSKDTLIKKIDFSLIDDKENKELEEIIKANVFIPIIYPFRKMEIPEGDEISGE